MINAIPSKLLISTGLLFLVLIVGFILHRMGRPYQNVLFTLHKLCSLGAIVLFAVVMSGFLKAGSFGTLPYLAVGIIILSTLGLLVSGGLMSADKAVAPMLLLHRVGTVAFVLSYVYLFVVMYRG